MKVSPNQLIDHASYRFRLYATMDCILLNRIGRCTLDFKTGKSALTSGLFAGISTKQQAVAS